MWVTNHMWVTYRRVRALPYGECKFKQPAAYALHIQKQGITWCSLVLMRWYYGPKLDEISEILPRSSTIGRSLCSGRYPPLQIHPQTSVCWWSKRLPIAFGDKETTCCTNRSWSPHRWLSRKSTGTSSIQSTLARDLAVSCNCGSDKILTHVYFLYVIPWACSRSWQSFA